MQSMLLRENPLRGVSPRLGENRNRSRNLTTILTPDVPLTPIPTGVAGHLREDVVRFVLGHSSLSFQKIKKDLEKELKSEKERNGKGRNQGTHQDRKRKLKKEIQRKR